MSEDGMSELDGRRSHHEPEIHENNKILGLMRNGNHQHVQGQVSCSYKGCQMKMCRIQVLLRQAALVGEHGQTTIIREPVTEINRSYQQKHDGQPSSEIREGTHYYQWSGWFGFDVDVWRCCCPLSFHLFASFLFDADDVVISIRSLTKRELKNPTIITRRALKIAT